MQAAGHGRLDRVPAPGLVVGAIAGFQLGAALAKELFEEVGPGGAVLLRLAFGAVALGALARPAVRGHPLRDVALVVAFGLSIALTNLTFYLAIERIPLGVAVTIQFAGPLAVGLVGSRRPLDLVWVALAAAGIVLLGGGVGEGTDAVGLALALLAAVGWAAYILLSARVGRRFADSGGLALALAVGAVLLVPVGVLDGGAQLLDPAVLAVGALVALLSSALPFSLELRALRRLPAGTFGVLMSLEPAAAALVGLVVLGEALAVREWVAIVLVVAASIGAARGARRVAVHE